MYQINYKGLKKRDSYDEIVAIIESGGGKIKYPDRYATQLSNSPYMKQIDAETLLDLQDQALKAQKGQLKNLIIKEMADKTGTPHKLLHALTQRDKSELAVKEAQKHLQDIAVGDDDREDFRSAVGDEIAQHERRAVEKMAAASRLASAHLEGVNISPVSSHSQGVQAVLTTTPKETQTAPYREEGPGQEEYAKKIAEQTHYIAELRREALEREKENRLLRERSKATKASSSVAASSFDVSKNLMPMFSSVATGISNAIFPKKPISTGVYGYGSPLKEYRERSKSRTPISSMDRGEAKSETVTPKKSEEKKSDVKSENKSAASSSGMAKPVEPASRTPSLGKVKSEPVSAKSGSSASGMAKVVGIASASGSGDSHYIGTPRPASTAHASQSAQTISSSPGTSQNTQGSSSSRSRGQGHGRRGRPSQFP